MSGRLLIDVMISSTSLDLPEHRKEAIDAVIRARMSSWSMETLAPGMDDALEVSLKLVDKSEIYIGIFGMRYGYIPDDPVRNPKRLSITELEYRRALERDIPILIYIMHDDHPVPSRKAKDKDTFFEPTDAGKKKLKALKEEIEKRHVVGYFKSPIELRALIVQSLNDPDVVKMAMERAGELDKPAVKDEIGIPALPDLYSVPPYTPSKFIGRAAELNELEQWIEATGEPIIVIEAIGGMGKSALTWEFVRRLLASDKPSDYQD